MYRHSSKIRRTSPIRSAASSGTTSPTTPAKHRATPSEYRSRSPIAQASHSARFEESPPPPAKSASTASRTSMIRIRNSGDSRPGSPTAGTPHARLNRSTNTLARPSPFDSVRLASVSLASRASASSAADGSTIPPISSAPPPPPPPPPPGCRGAPGGDPPKSRVQTSRSPQKRPFERRGVELEHRRQSKQIERILSHKTALYAKASEPTSNKPDATKSENLAAATPRINGQETTRR